MDDGKTEVVEWVMGGTLVAAAVTASWFDVRERRVPNALTVPFFVFALLAGGLNGLPGFGVAVIGAGICLAFSIPLFLLGGLGGGDVKLVAGFGAFLGPERLLPAFIAMALVGGLLAAVEMVRKGAVRRTFRNLGLMWFTLGRGSFKGWKGEGPKPWLTIDTPGAVTVPYAVAISAGALFGWFYGT